ncbi:tRNA methyltransferase 10 homolog A [Nilaparvata lugens]|uniref:tRNA methyltransferase 10 homolog A n=1 Tax=Nilaparvata lugens TaxID=108931 RepID=UPI00193E20E3|nr:tRNA methyltransferase 10 homolog A [Nilaparvata lugens]
MDEGDQTSLKRKCEDEIGGTNKDKLKRRRMNLDIEIMNIGYEGSKEELKSLSKRQKKKLLRSLKSKKVQPIKRKEERLRKKMKKVFAKLNNLKLGPSRKTLKRCLMSTSACKVTVAIDLSFDDLMNEKEMQSCLKQINRCYCANRRVANPMQFHVTNFNGKSEELMEKQNAGFRNWDVNFHSSSHLQVFDKPNLVYLTSDSPNILYDLDETKTYVIGGLVDHNRHKLMCYRRATEQSLAHARLPITEMLQMSTRKVLAINHVFEILLEVSTGKSWKDAFLAVIPLRKGAKAKEEGQKKEEGGGRGEQGGEETVGENLYSLCKVFKKGEKEEEGRVEGEGMKVEEEEERKP